MRQRAIMALDPLQQKSNGPRSFVETHERDKTSSSSKPNTPACENWVFSLKLSACRSFYGETAAFARRDRSSPKLPMLNYSV
jgi:hypothetical protein